MMQTATATIPDPSFQVELRARLRNDEVDLPVLPAAAQDVLRMTGDPNTNGRQLAAKISGDPALSAHVLRVANSALYAGGFTLTSIRQAVGRLGMELLGQIAATVAIQSTALDNKRFQTELEKLWRHSLRRGLCAREIARLRRDNIEQAFLGGLLRDLGHACVYRELDRLSKDGHVFDIEHARVLAFELNFCAGAALSRTWELDPKICSCMLSPYHCDSTDNTQHTVELADQLACELETPVSELMEKLGSNPACRPLELSDAGLAQLLAARARIQESASAMS